MVAFVSFVFRGVVELFEWATDCRPAHEHQWRETESGGFEECECGAMRKQEPTAS
jgi:hypothetical protein